MQEHEAAQGAICSMLTLTRRHAGSRPACTLGTTHATSIKTIAQIEQYQGFVIFFSMERSAVPFEAWERARCTRSAVEGCTPQGRTAASPVAVVSQQACPARWRPDSFAPRRGASTGGTVHSANEVRRSARGSTRRHFRGSAVAARTTAPSQAHRRGDSCPMCFAFLAAAGLGESRDSRAGIWTHRCCFGAPSRRDRGHAGPWTRGTVQLLGRHRCAEVHGSAQGE